MNSAGYFIFDFDINLFIDFINLLYDWDYSILIRMRDVKSTLLLARHPNGRSRQGSNLHTKSEVSSHPIKIIFIYCTMLDIIEKMWNNMHYCSISFFFKNQQIDSLKELRERLLDSVNFFITKSLKETCMVIRWEIYSWLYLL